MTFNHRLAVHFLSSTLTAIPYISDDIEAAVALALGTLSELVSLKYIFSIGIDKQRAQTCTILV